MDSPHPPRHNSSTGASSPVRCTSTARQACATRSGHPTPDLAPQSHTLRQLVERCILVRRGRAWHLRRQWYARLTALRARAVDTPPLTLTERPAPDLPTYAELEAWEALCRWLDLQPKQRAHLPFLSLAPSGAAPALGHAERADTIGEAVGGQPHEVPALDEEQRRHLLDEQAGQLRSMRRYRLVRHLSTCEWALSPKWRDQLHALWQGVNMALREYSPPQLAPAAPRSLCAGLDTWGLNWLVEEQALPARLRRDLDDLQQQAQREEREIETPWIFDGAPLRLYQTGVRPKNGKGVSWSYVLVNPSLRLLIRRVPLGWVVANARLGSECLWRRTPRAALDELHALIRRLWGKDAGRWQVSYAHLAHDVANAPLEREQLDCYVSRSRRRAIYDAAQAELGRMLRETRLAYSVCEDGDEDEELLLELGYDWEGAFADEEELLLADPFAEEGDAWEQTPHRSRAGQTQEQAREALNEEAEQRSCHAYVWGKRLSGVAFSPGGAISFVMYRKDWEGRLKSKRHMEPIWKAAGWDGKEAVTRHEARLVREPIRELHIQGVVASVLDDPWQFLDHEHDVWAAIVGRSDNETCPDAVDVAWIRRVVPREDESNRSRLDTDPVWRVVQQASFTPIPLSARRMVRRRQREQDVKKLDRQLLGVLKKREALQHPDPSGRDVSLALRDVVVPLERELVARGEQFDQAVRAKRLACGLPVPLTGRVLPLRPVVPQPEEVDVYHQRVRELEQEIPPASTEPTAPGTAAAVLRAAAGSTTAGWAGRTGGPVGEIGQAGEQRTSGPDGDAVGEVADEAADEARWGRWGRWAWLRARSAEVRMWEAYHALEEAELRERSAADLDLLERNYLRAVDAWSAARRMWSTLAGDEGDAADAGDGGDTCNGPPVA